MDKELRLLLPLLDDISEVAIGDTTYYTGLLGGHPVTVCKCGIGKVNAALGAAALIDTFHPELVVNTGVAGGTGMGEPPLKPLDVLLADAVAYHDVWCGPGTVPGQAAGFPERFECPLGDNVRRQLGASGGLLASGDVFIDGTEALARVLSVQPQAVAVDMESAAVAQVCCSRGVPFVCLRVISDTPGDGGNAAAYDNFWEDAPRRTFEAVDRLMKLL